MKNKEQVKGTSPLMKQVLKLKEQYENCILLVRVGDFYEMFYDDARSCSDILKITLTKRGEIPMAGFPIHSTTSHIKKLLEHNKKIAFFEQVENLKQTKGLMRREITKVLTPGTIIEEDFISSSAHNYICCIYSPKSLEESFGISFIDISTGTCSISQTTHFPTLKSIIRQHAPREIVYNKRYFGRGLHKYIKSLNIMLSPLSDVHFNYHMARQIIKKQFKADVNQLGLLGEPFSIISCGALLFYIYSMQKVNLEHISNLQKIENSKELIIGETALKNLEIVEPSHFSKGGKTLFSVLNETKTKMGERLLRRHIMRPLRLESAITKRLDSIEELNKHPEIRSSIQEHLLRVCDIERVASRISTQYVTLKDFLLLEESMSIFPTLRELLKSFSTPLLRKLKKIPSLTHFHNLLCTVLNKEEQSKKIISPEADENLVKLHKTLESLEESIKVFEREEKERLKTSSFKVKENKIIGKFIEISNKQPKEVPKDYVLKQTLSNVSRYTCPALREKESEIREVSQKIKLLETEIFQSLIKKCKFYIKTLQNTSKRIALLDVLCSHSYNSQNYNYVKPTFSKTKTISQIIGGRNPVIEREVTNYIPNDCIFSKKEKIKLITGPNMVGKSTYLRQMGLIIIMAQMGSFVPATKANLKLYDKIFTRIGAHDELVLGNSTFMVEMSETASILNSATKNSLVLLDEVGRGTSTTDGLSLAWAITEYLHEKECDCLFATHYHELIEIAESLKLAKNYHLKTIEKSSGVEFLRTIEKGGMANSFGIYVAKLAGVPKGVIKRAEEIQRKNRRKKPVNLPKIIPRGLNKFL